MEESEYIKRTCTNKKWSFSSVAKVRQHVRRGYNIRAKIKHYYKCVYCGMFHLTRRVSNLKV